MNQVRPLLLVMLSEIVYILLQEAPVSYTAKEGLLGVLLICGAASLALLVSSNLRPFCWSVRAQKGYRIFCGVMLAFSAVRILLFGVGLYRREYAGTGLWCILVAAFFLLLSPSWSSVCRISGAVFLLSVLCGLTLLTLVPQLRWTNLSFAMPEWDGVWAAVQRLWYFCPEFLLLPYLPHQKAKKRVFAYPLYLFMLQGAVVTGAECLFGGMDTGVRFAAVEAVRSCGVGSFTRLDDVMLGLWIMLVLYRIMVIRSLWNVITGGEA